LDVLGITRKKSARTTKEQNNDVQRVANETKNNDIIIIKRQQ
jgi:hypothetical protein